MTRKLSRGKIYREGHWEKTEVAVQTGHRVGYSEHIHCTEKAGNQGLKQQN